MPPSSTDADATVAEVGPTVQSLQIIHVALMAGVAAYLVFMLSNGVQFTEESRAFPLFPLGFAVMMVVMSSVVPHVLRRASLAELRGKSRISTASLLGPFQIGHIVKIALLEAAAFLSCFALSGAFGEVPRWFVAVPIALLVLMAIRFPRVASVAHWVSMAREELAL
jgi:hypothetical protein